MVDRSWKINAKLRFANCKGWMIDDDGRVLVVVEGRFEFGDLRGDLILLTAGVECIGCVYRVIRYSSGYLYVVCCILYVV